MNLNETDISEFESYLSDAFFNLEQAVNMVDKKDNQNLLNIKRIIENYILIHKSFILNTWLKKKIKKFEK